jgi:hypothetical protein
MTVVMKSARAAACSMASVGWGRLGRRAAHVTSQRKWERLAVGLELRLEQVDAPLRSPFRSGSVRTSRLLHDEA